WLPLITSLLTLTGCQTVLESKTQTEGPKLLPAELPSYTAGEFFMFDKGIVNTVQSKSGNIVEWKNNYNITRRALSNFVIPDLAWTNRTRKSKGETTAHPGTLWPLKVGNRAVIPFNQVITNHDGSDPMTLTRDWECAVAETATISVMAGTFDTYQIICKRFSETSGRLRATRTFYYAPSIGHYVLKEDDYRSNPDKRQELVAYGFNSTYLPKREQGELINTLDKTLNRNPDGIASTWTTKSGKVTAMLVPTTSYRSDEGSSCREYKSIYNIGGRIGTSNLRNVCKKQGKNSWIRAN
ncbi:MAG: hypothetical protein RPU41_13545, partial [Candidatus Sedimenticola sp. (ex Thyasira tokunagai)]